MSTDRGVEGLIDNIRRAPNDDDRKRLFELATANNGTYFTASQVFFSISTGLPTLRHAEDTYKVFTLQMSRRKRLALRWTATTASMHRLQCPNLCFTPVEYLYQNRT